MVKGLRRSNFLGAMDEEIPIRKHRFTEAQIMGVLRRTEGGMPVPEQCREQGICSAKSSKWRAKYGGMDARS